MKKTLFILLIFVTINSLFLNNLEPTYASIYPVSVSGQVLFSKEKVVLQIKTSPNDIVLINGEYIQPVNSIVSKEVILKKQSTLVIANPDGRSVKVKLTYPEIPSLLKSFLPALNFSFDTGKLTFTYSGKLARRPKGTLKGNMSNKESKDSVTFAVDSSGNFAGTLKMAEGKNTIQSYVRYLLLVKYSLPDFTVEIGKSKVIKLIVNNKWMYVDGVKSEVDPGRSTTPVIIPDWGRTLLPIRTVIESLGGTLSWDGTDRKVTINISNTKIELWINKNYAYVNNKKVQIDSQNSKVTPIIVNSRTMLPIRFVAESIGAYVNWNGTEKSILIVYPKD
ncbi:MAG: stalk domain-containing protein [Caldisericum sp.]|uniref:stalk domain-containing protein n=1 Tax=Caldisericum sp. TaxID=2499687 RepID=UPI003D0B09C1